jgi:hypothetical protein
LFVILALCLVAIAVPATPAQADGPSITLSPHNGVPGANVTLKGSNFTANKYVDVYYDDDLLYIYVDGTHRDDVLADEDGYFEATFFVPASYTGAHTVRAEGSGNISASAGFTVEPGLSVSPLEGPVGTTVTVAGHGFAGNETAIELRYYLSSNYTTIAQSIRAGASGNWTRSFQIPSSAKGNHKIDAWGANSSLSEVEDATFAVTPVISLSRLSGSPGESITMTGNGFAAGDREITIVFQGKEVNTETRVDADANGHWDKDFEVPDMPKGTYSVTAYGESTPKQSLTAQSFAIKPDIVLSDVQGYVGMNLSVAARGFAASRDAAITYDGIEVATDTTDNTGSFDVVFPVPESQHGGHQVTAEDAAGNSATELFTMESVAPGTPELTSPSNGTRVGFIGQVKPAFAWSTVSDASGVYYNLQIATSANVTTAGNFAGPLVSVTGLVTTNYTLNATEALPYGTYYWIVQAVDRAGNAGGWSEVRSFRAALLPMWGFIAAIAAIVILIGALVYFFVIRKRTTRYY